MPIEPATLHAYLLACLAVYLAPGPDMAFIGSNAITHGLKIGLWAALGPVIGCAVQAIAAVVGLGTALYAYPLLFDAIRWAGVAYLVYLGIKVLRSGAVAIDREKTPRPAPLTVMARGVMVNLLNPKLALFFMAFLPQFVDRQRGDVQSQLLCLCAIFAGGAVLWCAFQAYAFARAGAVFAGSQRAQRWQRRIAGGSFLGFAAVLALSEAKQ